MGSEMLLLWVGVFLFLPGGLAYCESKKTRKHFLFPFLKYFLFFLGLGFVGVGKWFGIVNQAALAFGSLSCLIAAVVIGVVNKRPI